MLAEIESELIAAKPFFTAFSPGADALLLGKPAKLLKYYGHFKKGYKWGREVLAGKHVAEIVGEEIAQRVVIKRLSAQPKKLHLKAHAVIANRKERSLRKGIDERSWYSEPGRHTMVIVFHDANKAGPHVDVHIGTLSLIYRVKPDLYERLRYNRDGLLTQDSQKLLLDHVRSEINNGSRVPQNLDHPIAHARTSWTNGDTTDTSYGSGRTRQVISESEVDVYKASADGPIEMYAPALNPMRPLYLYRLYPGEGNKAPICIWGAKKAAPPAFEDRLHLKMIDPADALAEGMPATKIDWSTSTAKYDGSSCYLVITPKGTTVWSPRQSKTHGHQIEYTMKLNGIASAKAPHTIIAMGEVLFKRDGKYLSAAEGSGILNSNSVLPDGVKPEIRLYRVDRVGSRHTIGLDYWANRKLQQEVAKLSPFLQVVEEMGPSEAKARGFEGVVAVPQRVLKDLTEDEMIQASQADQAETAYIEKQENGLYQITFNAPVTEGVKVKWWRDADDWRIDSVDFCPGEKGGIAGVVWCTSLESGKRFKLGPGQVGDRALCKEMMAKPEAYIGSVLKVNSRHGHEGRAAKVIGFHDDKGFAPS